MNTGGCTTSASATTDRSGRVQPMADSTTKQGTSTPKIVAIVVLAGALLAFIVQNTKTVDLDWLMFGFSAPLWLMITLIGAAGFIIGYFVGRPGRAARKG